MSDVISIKRLIDGVDVEWKSLEYVFDIKTGGNVPKGSLSEIETINLK